MKEIIMGIIWCIGVALIFIAVYEVSKFFAFVGLGFLLVITVDQAISKWETK